MEAGEARQQTQTAIERMRLTAEDARDKDRLDAEAELQRLEETMATTVSVQRLNIDMIIAEAAKAGLVNTSFLYSERISASRNSREEVEFIEDIANAVAQRLVTSLQSDGFKTTLRSREIVDNRDNLDNPPEYYDTNIGIKWEPVYRV